MDQYPDHRGLDSNYSYNFGIFSTCNPGDKYVRAYDQETKYTSMKDCNGCAGCDAVESKDTNNNTNNKEMFTPKEPPVPLQQQYYTPMAFTPSPSLKNDDKFNIVIIVLLAFIVVILLINNFSSKREPQIKYILVSKEQLLST